MQVLLEEPQLERPSGLTRLRAFQEKIEDIAQSYLHRLSSPPPSRPPTPNSSSYSILQSRSPPQLRNPSFWSYHHLTRGLYPGVALGHESVMTYINDREAYRYARVDELVYHIDPDDVHPHRIHIRAIYSSPYIPFSYPIGLVAFLQVIDNRTYTFGFSKSEPNFTPKCPIARINCPLDTQLSLSRAFDVLGESLRVQRAVDGADYWCRWFINTLKFAARQGDIPDDTPSLDALWYKRVDHPAKLSCNQWYSDRFDKALLQSPSHATAHVKEVDIYETGSRHHFLVLTLERHDSKIFFVRFDKRVDFSMRSRHSREVSKSKEKDETDTTNDSISVSVYREKLMGIGICTEMEHAVDFDSTITLSSALNYFRGIILQSDFFLMGLPPASAMWGSVASVATFTTIPFAFFRSSRTTNSEFKRLPDSQANCRAFLHATQVPFLRPFIYKDLREYIS